MTTRIIISFQFSPVSTINMVIKALMVEVKLYLDGSPSSSSSCLSLKNYLVRRAEMNRYRMIRTPRLVIAVSESSTVERRILKLSQDLMILKILSSLKALSTERPPPSPGMDISTKLMITIKQSKMLNPSEKYFFNPNPIILRIISRAKMYVKK